MPACAGTRIKRPPRVYQATTRASRRPSCCRIRQFFNPCSAAAGFFLFPTPAAGILTTIPTAAHSRTSRRASGFDYHLTDACHGLCVLQPGIQERRIRHARQRRRLSADEKRLRLGDRGQLRGGNQVDAARRYAAAESDGVLRSLQQRPDRRAAVRRLPGHAAESSPRC